jgi:hypothetical protein
MKLRDDIVVMMIDKCSEDVSAFLTWAKDAIKVDDQLSYIRQAKSRLEELEDSLVNLS